jgi:ribonuclease HI
MIVTHAFIEAGASDRGGWTRDQLELLGVEWPPPHGWRRRVAGKPIDQGVADRFLALRGLGRRRERKPRTKRSERLSLQPQTPEKPTPDLKANIYTDGCCIHGRPVSRGGYAALVVKGGVVVNTLTQGFRDTTNNRMEIMAALVALQSLDEPHDITLFSDSEYLVNSIMRGWAKSWRHKGWWEKPGLRRKNYDLFSLLLDECERHRVVMKWVRGHSGHAENEMCDQMAGQAANGGNLATDVFHEMNKREKSETPAFSGATTIKSRAYLLRR